MLRFTTLPAIPAVFALSIVCGCGAAGSGPGAGEDGASGATGAAGESGASGATGAEGAAGAQGATGDQGEAGAPGPTGAPGEPGADGATGEVGPTGATGATGADAPVPPVLVTPLEHDISVETFFKIDGVVPPDKSNSPAYSAADFMDVDAHSDYTITAAGVTPLFVIAFATSRNVPIFLNALVDQAPLPDLTLAVANGVTGVIVRTIMLSAARVETVSVGARLSVVAFSFGSLTDTVDGQSVVWTADATISARADNAMANLETDQLLVIDTGFAGDAPPPFSGPSLTRSVSLTFGHSPVSARVQVVMEPDSASLSIAEAAATTTPLTPFRVRFRRASSPGGVSNWIFADHQCTSAEVVRYTRGRGGLSTDAFDVVPTGCTLNFNQVNGSGSVTATSSWTQP